MHDLSIELIEKLADILQTGKSAPNHKVTVRRGNKDKTYEEFPFVLTEVTRITIERRWNMAADEVEIEMSNINGYYSPDYGAGKSYKNVRGELPLSGYKNVIQAFNEVECDLGYGNSLVRMFTGQIQSIDIRESPPSIKFNALNVYRKLLKPIDPINTRELVYEDETAFNIIKDLCNRAGIETIVYDNETIISTKAEESENSDSEEQEDTDEGAEFQVANDFKIKGKVTFLLGTDYSDSMKKILDIMNHRITGGRYGEIQILKNKLYTQRDFHNWEFDDFIDLSEGVYKIDSSIIRNRVIIMSRNGWQAFEDPYLVNYCNGEIISSGLEVEWAEELEQKWAVADNFFLSMRRRIRRISVAIRGNPAMDIGDLVKMRMLTSTATGKYVIIAIRSNYSNKGYIDQVDLEYAAPTTGRFCEPAEGDYGASEDEGEGGTSSPVVMTLRDKIVDEAKKYLGIYYQWGGSYPDTYGLDCSHFTWRVLNTFGLMDGYRVAHDQKNWCKSISRDELLPGDLVFYTWGGSRVAHVVMYIGNGQIIGANGGGQSTKTAKIAQNQGAKVKIQPVNYGPPAFYGRPPGLA